MFVYKHAKMNTKSSVQPYAQCQPHDKANHRYCSGARMAPSRHCDKHRNAATYHQSLAATAGAGCSSNRWSAGLRCERRAAVSDGSQLGQRGRQVAGATTHRPLRSMSRRVSDAPHMRSPHSRRGHGRGTWRPLKWRLRQIPYSH